MIHIEGIDIDFFGAGFWREGLDGWLGRVEFFLDQRSVESHEVEIGVEFAEVREFQLEHFLIPPAADLGEAVVGEDVGSALRVGEVAEADAGDGFKAEWTERP